MEAGCGLAVPVFCFLVTVGIIFITFDPLQNTTVRGSRQAIESAADVPVLRSESREQATLRSSSSSYSCTGVKWGEDYRLGPIRCSECRTCRFDNVCLNHSSLDVLFYKGNQDVLYYHEQTGEAQYTFPADFVMLGHSHISPYVHWAPLVVPGPMPANASFSKAPVAAVSSLNDFASNFGHVLFDFLLPVYNMLSISGLYHPDFQLLLAKHQGANPSVIKEFIQPPDDDHRMLASISQRKAYSLEDFAAHEQQMKNSSELTCFSSLVAGSALLDGKSQRLRFLPFRTAAFANLGIAEAHNNSIPRITMLKKEGRRIIENADEVTSHLRQRFTEASFETLEGKDIAKMSLKEQLEAMSKTDILITPCGGVGTVLMFLPQGATAVVMNYWDNVATKSVQMEAIYYWNLEFLDMQYFPVLAEDYELTTDRPECEKPTDDPHYETQGAFIHCNVYLKNLDRLEHIIGNALHRWAVRHHQHRDFRAPQAAGLAGTISSL